MCDPRSRSHYSRPRRTLSALALIPYSPLTVFKTLDSSSLNGIFDYKILGPSGPHRRRRTLEYLHLQNITLPFLMASTSSNDFAYRQAQLHLGTSLPTSAHMHDTLRKYTSLWRPTLFTVHAGIASSRLAAGACLPKPLHCYTRSVASTSGRNHSRNANGNCCVRVRRQADTALARPKFSLFKRSSELILHKLQEIRTAGGSEPPPAVCPVYRRGEPDLRSRPSSAPRER